MRVTEDRYIRDLRQIHLAQRMVRNQLRTQSISAWTGLTGNQVRNLCRSLGPGASFMSRHRGPPPTRLTRFLQSPTLRSEASALAAVATVLGVIPAHPVPDPERSLPGIERGEKLCQTFELFKRLVPESNISMDQFTLLVLRLAKGEDLQVVHCLACHAALLVDPLSNKPRQCIRCCNAPVEPTEMKVDSAGRHALGDRAPRGGV